VSRRQPLSRDRIVEAALALADRDGPEALSMRRLGRELGVEGMAIYGYFGSKDELVGAVAARVLAGLDLAAPPGATWQERVRHVVREWAGLRDRHPGGFRLIYARREATSEDLAPVEELLGALHDAGLPPERSVLAYHVLVWMLDGILLAGSYGDAPVNEVWQRTAAGLETAAYPRFVEAAPHAARVTARQIFELGADLLVRGLERLTEGAGDAGPGSSGRE
jgi:AcrR family transcriptional regulator